MKIGLLFPGQGSKLLVWVKIYMMKKKHIEIL